MAVQPREYLVDGVLDGRDDLEQELWMQRRERHGGDDRAHGHDSADTEDEPACLELAHDEQDGKADDHDDDEGGTDRDLA